MANLNKQAKLQYFEKLSVDGNFKPFWKARKPYFPNKNSNIQENIMLLKMINFYQNKRMSLKFSINISNQLQTRKISLVGPKILKCHQGMTQLTTLLKKLSFTKV